MPNTNPLNLKTSPFQQGSNIIEWFVSGVSGEKLSNNNVRDFFIQVLDSRVRITLVAQAPHPDISAIKAAAESSQNFDFNLHWLKDGMPNLEETDVIVLVQIPMKASVADQALIEEVLRKKKPTLWIQGAGTNWNRFNSIQNLIQVTAEGANGNFVSGKLNPGFQSFAMSDELGNAIGQFPPLQTAFGSFDIQSNAEVCFFRKLAR